MTPKIHLEVLPARQAEVWTLLGTFAPDLERWGFYLAGGTALALQLGHRESVDFDFFTQRTDVGPIVRERLETAFPELILREADPNTVHADLRGVRLSFIGGYKYPLVRSAVTTDAGIFLADILDIALMKLLAVSHRAAVRDYVDLAAVLRDRLTLSELIEVSMKKYGPRFNAMVSLRALVAFDDLDAEMPKVLDTRLEKSWRRILLDAVKSAS